VPLVFGEVGGDDRDWRPGTLGFWDNRTTMHYGIYDYGDERRIMHRVTLQGKAPKAT
jgi:alpha-ketoglutarate-dependent taurine dioxygenase